MHFLLLTQAKEKVIEICGFAHSFFTTLCDSIFLQNVEKKNTLGSNLQVQ